MTQRGNMPAGTTHPDSVTGRRSGGGLLALRWVVPQTKITPLGDGLVFGREPDCSAMLPGQDVSRRHAEVRRAGVLPLLCDLGSRNGSWVNGQRIQERTIGPGDVVRIGEWVGIVVELSPDRPLHDLIEIADRWFGGPALARAIEPAKRLATADLPIVVQGETGTGKEGAARAIHGWSGRRGAFVAVNCASVPAAMAEAELFGYRKGAFTGADRASPGFFRAAHGGTLFLDEVLELPAAVQSKLLRTLEQREVQPLGEPSPVPVDVRVVSAAQEPLGRAVAERRFRADLLARLDGLTVVLPPLRERREDIVPLFLRFLSLELRRAPPPCDPKAIEALLLYDFPLNVRELVLLVRRLAGMHGGEPILKRAMLPDRITGAVPTSVAPGASPTAARSSAVPPARAPTDDEIAFEQLIAALRAAHGNVSQAAAALGITRGRAYRLLEARPDFDVRSLRRENEP